MTVKLIKIKVKIKVKIKERLVCVCMLSIKVCLIRSNRMIYRVVISNYWCKWTIKGSKAIKIYKMD